jgi:hypothetical protein
MNERRQLTPRQAELLEHVLMAALRPHDRPYTPIQDEWQAIGLIDCAVRRWKKRMDRMALMYQATEKERERARYASVELAQLTLHVLFDLLAEEGHGKPRPEML